MPLVNAQAPEEQFELFRSPPCLRLELRYEGQAQVQPCSAGLPLQVLGTRKFLVAGGDTHRSRKYFCEVLDWVMWKAPRAAGGVERFQKNII